MLRRTVHAAEHKVAELNHFPEGVFSVSHARNEIKHSDFVNFIENKHKSVQAQACFKIDSNKHANKNFEIMPGDYNQT